MFWKRLAVLSVFLMSGICFNAFAGTPTWQTDDGFRGIDACINDSHEWIKGDCKGTKHDDHAITATCRRFKADDDATWSNYSSSYVDKAGNTATPPSADGDYIYRCVSLTCDPGYEPKAGWCQPETISGGCTVGFTDGNTLEHVGHALWARETGYIWRVNHANNADSYETYNHVSTVCGEKVPDVDWDKVKLVSFVWDSNPKFVFMCQDGFKGENKKREIQVNAYEFVDGYEKCVEIPKQLTGGATLEFDGGKKYEHVDTATWWFNEEKTISIKNTNNEDLATSYASDIDLKNLKKVNGEIFDFSNIDPSKVNVVYFKSGKYKGHYFAYDCQDGYEGGNKIGTDEGADLYDECIKTPEQSTGDGATLEFADGIILEHVASATWWLDGDTFIWGTDTMPMPKKALKYLQKINGDTFNFDADIDWNEDTVSAVLFKSERFSNGSYFAYNCKYGYDYGNKITDDDGTVLYDKCVKQEEKKKNETPKNTDNDAKNLASAVGNVDAVLGGLKVRKFRDADGNINTARLISDSVAGVVLGTAGGIITSMIVKKNQLKKGFEDIVCTIGGQEVAGYGDEMTVGVH